MPDSTKEATSADPLLDEVTAALLGEALEPAEDLPATDPGARLPGDDYSLKLDEEEKTSLGGKLADLIIEHDTAKERRWRKLDRCLKNYDMEVDHETTGIAPFSAQLCSELTKTKVDQAKARIAGAMLAADPLISVRAFDPGGQDREGDAVVLAEDFEDFLDPYVRDRDTVNLESWLPLKLLRAAKVGTGVTYDYWEESEDTVFVFDEEGKRKEDTRETGGIQSFFVDHRDLILWPMDIDDWQRDYEMVGHRSRLSEWKFKEKCRSLGVDEVTIQEITAGAAMGDGEETDRQNLKRRQVDTDSVYDKRFQLTELWYHGAPGDLPAGKYQFFLHEYSRKLLYAGVNPLNCRKHPYWPLRYKRVDGFAEGEGIAEELIFAHAAMSSLDNLLVDNLKVNANDLLVVKEDTGAAKFQDQIYPGYKLVTENPKEDLLPVRLGGSLDNIYQALEQWHFKARAISGMPSVLEGQGDPVMKSGADASSVMALISEAGQKFKDIDRSIRDDFSAEVSFWCELIQQYAPDHIFATKVGDDRAEGLKKIKFEPPRGRFSDTFRIIARAPSALTNTEIQKQQLMVMNQLATEYLGVVDQLGMEIYSSEPAAQQLILDLKRQIFVFKSEVFRTLLKLHEQDSLMKKIPSLRPPTPAEEQIAQLMQVAQQLATQLQEVQVQNQKLVTATQFAAGGMDMAQAVMAASEQVDQQLAAAEGPVNGGGGGGLPTASQ